MPVRVQPFMHRKSAMMAAPFQILTAFADMRATNTVMWRDIFVEDVFVVEDMQKGRHSSQYDGGKFSAVMDAPTHRFYKWVATALSG